MALTERFVTADSDGGDGSSGNPWTLSEAIANCAAGDRINILSGTYTRTASDTIATAGTVGSPIIFRGVTSFSPLTPIVPTRTNGGALVTTGMPVIAYGNTYGLTLTSLNLSLQGLNITGNINGILVTIAGSATQATVNGQYHYGCVATNAASNASAVAWGRGAYGHSFSVVNCDGFLSGATNGSYVFAFNLSNEVCVVGCRAQNSSSSGAGCYQIYTGKILRSVACPSAGVGIIGTIGTGSQVIIKGCSIVGQATSGLQTVNAATVFPLVLENCIFSGNAYALLNPYNATAAHPLISVNNAYYNNTNPNLGFGDWPEQGRIDLASDPFVDAANGDFRLKPGSAARNAGLGGVDCGAIQHVDPTQPATTTVWFGTSYNDGLNTGEMRASDIANCEAGNIKDGVTIDDVTGTYDPVTGNYTDPGVEHVEDGVEYEFDGATLTGTLAGADPDTVIDTAGGDYVTPATSDVRLGTVYGYGAYEETGTLIAAAAAVSGSFDRLLTQIGSVSRNTPGAVDSYGQPAESWAVTTADTPCRIQATGGKEINRGQMVVIADYTIFLGPTIDITEEDRFVAYTVTYEILMVETKRAAGAAHHIECAARAIR